MKWLLAVALFAVCALAREVAGHWQASMDSQHGPVKGSLDFKQEGSKVTGTVELGSMGTFQLKGELDGSKIAFQVELGEREGTLKFEGTIDGDRITGSGTTPRHSFKWEATR